GGITRNGTCHRAANTSPMTMTRCGNIGMEKNSRIAKRYTMPASVKEDMKYGPPLSPKLREQIVSATHRVAPSMYTLHSGLTFTVLPCPSATVLPHVPTLLATPPFVAPSPEPDAIPMPDESGRQLHQYRKKEQRNLRKAQEFARATGVSPARCWCLFRRV